jgi:hypothetical protein
MASTPWRRPRLVVAAGIVLTAAVALPALGQPSPHRSPLPAAFEKQLTFDARYAEGEPSIAVNPRNPDNILLTYLRCSIR